VNLGSKFKISSEGVCFEGVVNTALDGVPFGSIGVGVVLSSLLMDLIKEKY